tara:strand:+ start:385 stop:675 length:291 start_codon:yes stop_codon:yes gene_type:complete
MKNYDERLLMCFVAMENTDQYLPRHRNKPLNDIVLDFITDLAKEKFGESYIEKWVEQSNKALPDSKLDQLKNQHENGWLFNAKCDEILKYNNKIKY